METLLPLVTFAVATSITPGPNVILVAANAARHGVGAVLPMMLGVTLGFGLMLGLVGLGLALPLAGQPMLQQAMQWIGAAWLCRLAWQIAVAPVSGPEQAEHRPPIGFLGMAGFQWINPKAWMIALAALPTYAAPGVPLPMMALITAAVFVAVSMPCLLVWAYLGQRIRGLLAEPARARLFNRSMALLLLLSLVPGLLAALAGP